jgi:hypothetical protein
MAMRRDEERLGSVAFAPCEWRTGGRECRGIYRGMNWNSSAARDEGAPAVSMELYFRVGSVP